jgi:hypothetical protein
MFLPEDLLHEVYSFLEDVEVVKIMPFVSKYFCETSRNHIQNIQIFNYQLDELINDETVASIMKLYKKIQVLDLLFCENLKNPKISSTTLKELDLSSTNIETKYLVSILNNNPNLKTFKINCMELDQDDAKLFQHQNVIFLCISETNVTRDSFECILENFPKLNKIECDACLVDSFLFKSQFLEHISLQYTKISNESLTKLLENCPNLKSLNLNHSTLISKENMEHKKLTELSLIGTSIEFFSTKNLPSLKDLNVMNCSRLTNIMIESSNLKTLNAKKTAISMERCFEIQKEFPTLKIEFTEMESGYKYGF